MAKKGPMPSYETVAEYIANQPKEAQEKLQELRTMILEVVPNAEEKINYKIPSFALVANGKSEHQLMMAAYAKFISFYPFPSTIAAFATELKPYKQGKGTVQFPYNQALPKDLIQRMVAYRVTEIEKQSN